MKKNNYLDKKELSHELIEYHKSGVISEKLGKMILDIATNIATIGRWSGYTWKDDMIGTAVEICIRYLHNVSPDKNPYAYLSKTVINSFKWFIIKEKRHGKIKDTCYKKINDIDTKDYNMKSIDYEELLN